jgi:hypothetical protein
MPLPGTVIEVEHHLGTLAFQIDEAVLGSLINDLEPQNVPPVAQACGQIEHGEFRHERREASGRWPIRCYHPTHYNQA